MGRRAVFESVEQKSQTDRSPPRAVSPNNSNTFNCSSRLWIRIEPPPSSWPLSTMSYASARASSGADSSIARSSGFGAVNGWFTEDHTLVVGAVVEHRKIDDPQKFQLIGFVEPDFVAICRRMSPSTGRTLSGGPRKPSARYRRSLIRRWPSPRLFPRRSKISRSVPAHAPPSPTFDPRQAHRMDAILPTR